MTPRRIGIAGAGATILFGAATGLSFAEPIAMVESPRCSDSSVTPQETAPTRTASKPSGIRASHFERRRLGAEPLAGAGAALARVLVNASGPSVGVFADSTGVPSLGMPL